MVNGINNNPFKLNDYSIKDTKVTNIEPENNNAESDTVKEETKKNITENQVEIGKYEVLASKQNLVKIDFEKVLKDEKNKTKDTKNIFSQTAILKDTVDKEADILLSLKTAVNEAIDEVTEDINTTQAKKKSIWDHLLHKVVSHAPVKPVANTGDTGSTYVSEESVSVDEGDYAVSEDSVSSTSVSDSSSAISSGSAGDSYSSSAEVAVYVED